MTDRREVIAPRAENLTAGVSYVRGWGEARRGSDRLAEQRAGTGGRLPGAHGGRQCAR
jgi:hypothetical protein